jgi:ABC-2 type transport system ATP-binding protein
LIVVGRGRVIADTTTEEFLEQASGNVVVVRSPQVEELRGQLVGADVTVVAVEPGLVEVHGLTAQQIGEAAARHRIVLHELTPQQVSLEEAFMDLTRDDVEFKTAAA